MPSFHLASEEKHFFVSTDLYTQTPMNAARWS